VCRSVAELANEALSYSAGASRVVHAQGRTGVCIGESRRRTRHRSTVLRQCARAPVVKLVDTADLKSAACLTAAYRFESDPGHHAPAAARAPPPAGAIHADASHPVGGAEESSAPIATS
jgi:hypothetical protein